MKKIIKCSFLTVTLAIIYFTNVSYSSGPPTNSATAGCSCHGPSQSPDILVTVSFNGGNLYYTNGQTYPITISVVSANGQPAAGFALSTNVGTFNSPAAGTQVQGNVWRHNVPQATNGFGFTSATWTINWTAPATGAVPLQIFASGNAVNLDGGPSGDEWAFASSLNVALPIIFTHFTASSFEKNIVLNWSIADEKNVKEYQIEQSENGIDFSTIGKVEANLFSKYQFIDASKSNSSLAYYRIKAIDMDGKFILSKIIKFEKESKSTPIKIYPTIVSENTMIQIQHNESQAELMIYNMNGQLVKTQQVTSSTSNFALNEISNGVYFVFIKTNNNISFVDKITLN
jgi:hypothetical protein